jgi:DNA-binding CsgD family transcriptional regulator
VAEGNGSQLSPRQIECLRLAAAGKTSAEIAAALGISSRTVDQYVGEACERLNVRNRIQAVAKALTLGLLPDAPP